jgi:alpha-tubulin suppressor-like RCC1 family protein
VAIALGSSSTCALLADRTVQCWGDNTYGQLGNGSSTGPEQCTAFATPCSTTPAPVAGLSGIVGIASGGISACARSKSGTVQCWGSNLDGQLGDGSPNGPNTCDTFPCSTTPVNGPNTCDTFPCSTTPVAVAGLAEVKALGAGTCVVVRRQGVHCWGPNENGELGIGTDIGPQTCAGGPCSTTPVGVPSLGRHVVQLSGTCALLSDGTVQCWGSNISGELGDGTAMGPEQCSFGPCSTTPTPVSL